MNMDDRLKQLEARIADLEKTVRRVDRLEDIEEIKVTKAKFALGADPVIEVESLVSLFADDAILEYTGGLGIKRGRDEIRAWFSDDPVPWRYHFFLPMRIIVADDGKTARGEWFMLALLKAHNHAENKLESVWCVATYDDDLAKIDGAWKFTHVRTSLRIFAAHATGWTPNELDIPRFVPPQKS